MVRRPPRSPAPGARLDPPTGRRGGHAVATRLVAALVAAAAPPAAAEDGRHLRHWSLSDGLPQGSVNALAETPDGALWVATFGGLARFDGTEFRTLDLATTALPSNRILALTTDAEGTLWGGAEEGLLFRLVPGRPSTIETWRLATRPLVLHLAFDHGGRLHLGTTHGLYAFDPAVDDAPRHDRGLPHEAAGPFAIDPEGTVWAGRADAIVRLGPDGPVPIRPAEDLGGGHHPVRVGDHLLTVTDRAVALVDGTTFRRAPLDDFGHGPLRWAGVDPDGALVACFAEGLVMVEGLAEWCDAGAAPVARTLLAIPARAARTAYVDRAGQIWIGHDWDGLQRLATTGVTLWRPEPRLADAPSRAVIGTGDGRIAAGIGTDLVRLDAGGTMIDTSPGLHPVVALASTADGGLLHAQGGTVHRLDRDGTRTVVMPEVPERGLVLSVASAPDDVIWIAAEHGLWRLRDDRLGRVPLPGTDDPRTKTTTVHLGRDGVVWVGGEHALFRVTGRRPRRFGLGRPDAISRVRTIVTRADGSVWAGTYGTGVAVVDRDDTVRLVTARDGLPENVVSALVVDEARGHLWMLGNRGAYRLPLAAWERFLAGTAPFPRYLAFGPEDGMVEGNSGQPAGALLPDGSVIFSTVRGVCVVRPEPARTSQIAAPVLDRLLVDGMETPLADGSVIVPADAGRVEIRLSAATLFGESSVQYACRLRGFDRDWLHLGRTRSVSYTNLPPGAYDFEFRAALGDGAWVPGRARLRLEREAAWYRTVEFRGGTALAGLLALAGGTVLVRRRHRARIADMEAAIRNREVARDREARLLDELNHRVRNNLASVVSLLRLGSDRVAANGDSSAVARIHTMANVHSLLSQRRWETVTLGEIIEGVVRPERPDRPGALLVSGDDPEVHAEACQALALVLHELAANARQHGAWTAETGVVRITTETNDDRDATIVWSESDGPAVAPPDELGTGLQLVRGFVHHDLAGDLDLRFAGEGVEARMRVAVAPGRG